MNKQKPLAGLKLFVMATFILLVIGLFIAVMVGVNILVGSWAWTLAAILLGVFLFLIINQTSLRNKLLPVLEIFFPIISKLQDEAQRRFENRSIVDKMEYTINRYRLFMRLKESARSGESSDHNAFSAKFQRTLINALLDEPDKKNTVTCCSNRVSREMLAPVSPKILTLFYRDLHETPNVMDYDEFTVDENQSLRLELAEILDNSGFLSDRGILPNGEEKPSREILLERGLMPNSEAAFPYSKTDIACLLRHYRTFELDHLVNDMRKLQKVWAITSNYLAFLVKNKALADDFAYSVADLLNSIEDESAGLPGEMELPERLDEKIFTPLIALKRAGRHGLKTSFGNLPVEERESLNLIALGMFFTEERKDLQDLRFAICQEAAKAEIALYQHLAYLEYREDLREATALDGMNFVSVRYIAEHWRQTVEKRKRELGPGFEKEIQAIRENLAEGNWWSRLPWVIEEVLKKIGKQIQEEIERFAKVMANRPPIVDVLRRIFRSLKLETIERFLEARTFTAYLLTFDGLEGSMANLVDSLSFFKGAKYRANLTRLGVRFTFRDREKYIFKDYIKQCRIGLIPMGMSFNKFIEEFEHDLTVAYQNREILDLPNAEISNFEVIIHRFGLSGRDRRGLENFNPDGLRPHAIPRVQELLACTLFPEDIVALICYEQSPIDDKFELEPIINDLLVLGTITEFVGDTIPKFTQAQKEALVKDDQTLKSKLLEKMGCDTLRNLARLLCGNTKEQADAKDMLARLISQLPEFKEKSQSPGRISAVYIKTLSEIGSLYG